MDENKLGKRILALRTERGMTQEEAAEKLGVSNKAFSKWETGANLPDVPTVVKLAEFFGVTTDSLLGLADTEPQSFGTAVAAWFAAHPENPADALLRMHEEILGVSKEYLYHNGNDGKRWTPEVHNARYPRRNCVTVNSCQFTVNSPEVNLSFALFRNEKDFAWLKDGEKRKGIAEVFSLLADPDAVLLYGLFHEAGFPVIFTAKNAAERAGIDTGKAEEILEKLRGLGIVGKETAHFAEGDTDLWHRTEDCKILFLITLAYEFRFGINANEIGYFGRDELIGGGEE